ncbi:MAG: spermidine/putrescine ABC transporter substrate-binding protein, partial [Clostridia bacterium]|nr:spermidine/putrescine ABC transporter substrate-binding protein [Clostridia bacterium]
MKKLVSLLLAVAMLSLVFSLASCSSDSSDRTLNLYTWAGMFPDEVIADFEAQTGIEVNYVNFDYDETMLAKLQAANGGDYDLVIADDYIIEVAIAEGLVQKLDFSKIPSADNVNPIYEGQFYDPTGEYTIPYGAGVQTIVYNPANISIDIQGYADLWDASLTDCVGIISNYRVINGMALKTMGESYNITDVAKIEAAGEKLKALAPNIRLIKDDYIQDDLLSGEIDAAVMYTSQVTMAMMTNPDLKVVFPEEGIGFGIMAMFIPSQAPDSDAAHAFIEYILDPAVSAKCYEWLGYYCTNAAAD